MNYFNNMTVCAEMKFSVAMHRSAPPCGDVCMGSMRLQALSFFRGVM